MKPAVIMELREAIQHFKQFLTVEKIAVRLGVSKNQVMRYANGKTTTCSDKVLDNFYDNFTLDSCPILIDNNYNSEADYIANRMIDSAEFRERLETSCSLQD